MKIKIVFLILLLVIISSCQTGNSGGGSSWATGSKGITLSVDWPSSAVKKGKSLKIPVEVENVGRNDKTVYVCAHGYDKNIIFGSDSVCNQVAVRGRTEFVPEGFGPEEIIFETGYNIQNTAGKYFKQTVKFSACYPDTTIAFPTLFIDWDKDTATIKDLSGSQGAPIGVGSIQVNIDDPDEIYMKINFKNTGGGTPYVQGSLSNCHALAKEYQGYISVNVDKGFQCDNTVRFPNKAYIECTRSTSDFGKIVNMQFTITANYNYWQDYGSKEMSFEGNQQV